MAEGDYKEVYFDQYCKKCKDEKTPEEIAANDAKNCRISDHIINIKMVNLTDKNGSGTRRFYDVTEAYLQSNECDKTFVIS